MVQHRTRHAIEELIERAEELVVRKTLRQRRRSPEIAKPDHGVDLLFVPAFDLTVKENALSGDQMLAAQHQLSICEGSDWFWWFGDYNAADTVSDFERLYRVHLSNLYTMLGKEPPEYLSAVFAHGGGSPAQSGVMRKGQYSG